MIIIDDFLKDYDVLKEYSLDADFANIKNPTDGVEYPLICADLPIDISERLSLLIGNPIQNQTIFMRQSPKGVDCPHKFHNDCSMGDCSFMLYLNNIPNGGTGLAIHKATGDIMPTDGNIEEYAEDQNNPDAWEVYKVCEAKENRACLFDSRLFHVALPLGGHGSGKGTRTVLTAFFS